MNLRNFVDALRRRPGAENSQSPTRPEDENLPPVEVADVVVDADRSLSPRGGSALSPLIPSVVNSFPSGPPPRRSGAVPTLHAPDPLTLPPPTESATPAFSGFDRLVDDLLEDNTHPEQDLSAMLMPPPLTPPPADWQTTLPPSAFTTQPAGEPVLAPQSLVAPSIPPRVPPTSGVPLELFEKLVSFSGRLAELPDAAAIRDAMAALVLECLGASRCAVVPIGSDGMPEPIEFEHSAGCDLPSLRGSCFPPSFTTKLRDQASLFDRPAVVDLAPGLSLLPADQFAPVEWYLLPDVDDSWTAVLVVQWQSGRQPSAVARPCAEMIARSARLALAGLAVERHEAVQETLATDGFLPARLAEESLRLLDEAILLCDRRLQVRFGNGMAEFVTGCFNGELTRNTLGEISQGPGRANAQLWQHLDRVTEPQQFDSLVSTPDGLTIPVSVSVVILPDFDEPQCKEFSGGRIIALRDVSRTLAQATEAARNERPAAALSLDESQLAEIRNSLTMVLGFSELLHRGKYGAMNPQQFEMFRNIEHHARQMAAVLNLQGPATP